MEKFGEKLILVFCVVCAVINFLKFWTRHQRAERKRWERAQRQR